jgi:lysophospholipase L1-like esterase
VAPRLALLWLLAILPAAAHFTAFSASVARQGYIVFGRTDLVVLLAAVAYVLAAPAMTSDARRAGRFLLLVYASLASLAIAEAVVRAVVIPTPLYNQYPWPPMTYVRKAAEEVSPGRGRIYFSVNTLGVRGPEGGPKESDLAILCIGGSTTECLYNTDEASWPCRVQSDLARAPGRGVYIGNAGRSGHTAANHAYLLRHYPGVERFDAVLVLCGVNDVLGWLRRDRDERRARVPNETLFDWSRPHDAYYRRLALWRLAETILDVGSPLARGQVFQDATGDWYAKARAARRRALQSRTFAELPADLDDALAHYRRDLIDVVQAARERGRAVAMMTQPTLWRADLPPELEDKLWQYNQFGAYTPAALAQAMDAFNQVMLDVCREHGVPCLDLASQLPKDASVFYDDCHFHDEGCRIVADRVAAWLARIADDLKSDDERSRSSAPPARDVDD